IDLGIQVVQQCIDLAAGVIRRDDDQQSSHGLSSAMAALDQICKMLPVEANRLYGLGGWEGRRVMGRIPEVRGQRSEIRDQQDDSLSDL
ncbi:MAG: hypothetical protein K8T91_07440, partial [Planctomycetes bacterium]|nr:hypothetical protein [Planctomycetota bacterium]